MRPNDWNRKEGLATETQKQVELKSDPLEEKILPLPIQNRPASFTGAVGDFQVVSEDI
jgi:hypothetical protein